MGLQTRLAVEDVGPEGSGREGAGVEGGDVTTKFHRVQRMARWRFSEEGLPFVNDAALHRRRSGLYGPKRKSCLAYLGLECALSSCVPELRRLNPLARDVSYCGRVHREDEVLLARIDGHDAPVPVRLEAVSVELLYVVVVRVFWVVDIAFE